ncbi:MAG: very short patch repair endonuclease [Thermoanaerobaculia bacterium]
MTDIVSADRRSEMMRSIRAKDTGPEVAVRSIVHGLGFRFRLHRRDLPGRPDLVLSRLGTVIFVHGCFWHRHPGCQYAYTPKSRPSFWAQKFSANVRRDAEAQRTLELLSWKVIVVWECELRAPAPLKARLRRELKRAERLQ